MMSAIIHQFRAVPEYFVAAKAGLAILYGGIPLYVGLRYILYRRHLKVSFGMTLNFVSVFLLFAGLAFVLASPLVTLLPGSIITAYLFLTCMASAFSVVSLIDV